MSPKLKVTFQLTASQPVCLGVEPPSGTHDQMLSLRSDRNSVSPLVASSLTRGRVSHLLFVVILVKFIHIYI
jgi:hypothetical protein